MPILNEINEIVGSSSCATLLLCDIGQATSLLDCLINIPQFLMLSLNLLLSHHSHLGWVEGKKRHPYHLPGLQARNLKTTLKSFFDVIPHQPSMHRFPWSYHRVTVTASATQIQVAMMSLLLCNFFCSNSVPLKSSLHKAS